MLTFILKLEYKKASYYSIKPLGYKKRNDIIEKYLRLKRNPNTINVDALLEEVKYTFDCVQSIIGDKLMPAYPIYILSIIQALQYKPIQQNETSYGYCYQTLIYYSLIKVGVKNENIDTYFNFLTELAYHFFNQNKEYISGQELNDFYNLYSKEFICPEIDEIIGPIKRAKIISKEFDEYKFSYNYILYYLAAKKIADLIHTEKGSEIINELFSNIEQEKNANILVLITHHSKDISFIDNSQLNSMMVLENVTPITLSKDDPFYKEIINIAESIKNDLIDLNRDPYEERENRLQHRDMQEDNKENKFSFEKEDGISNEMEEIMKHFVCCFRSIEIIGQIIKNRKGSLDKNKLKQLIQEIYTTGFRAVSYYSELLRSMNSDLKEVIKDDIAIEEVSKTDLANKIVTLLQFFSYKMCLSVFSKLTLCVGTKELKELYNETAKIMGTPAAKLVSFSINSYYGNVSIKEVKELADEFENNIVAMRILKSRVRFYVYNRNLDFKIKQQLASALKMTALQAPNAHKN